MKEDEQAPKPETPAAADDDISLAELLYWAEFCAWTALCLTPFLWWFNGPSVSPDQFYVRSGLVVISATTAVSLRAGKWWMRRRERGNEDADASDADQPASDG